jgi:hypothetical protein
MARRRLLTKKTRDTLSRTWGYFLLPALYLLWTPHDPSYAPIAIVSTLAALFFLFQARVPCGALKRDGETYCINNARGLLGGCNQVVAHKWYNAKMLVHRSTWGRFVRNACRRLTGVAATLAALATVVSAFISAGALVVATFAYLDPRAPK